MIFCSVFVQFFAFEQKLNIFFKEFAEGVIALSKPK